MRNRNHIAAAALLLTAAVICRVYASGISIIDYKGRNTGSGIPAWIGHIIAGKPDKTAKDLKLGSDKIWIVTLTDTDRSMLTARANTEDYNRIITDTFFSGNPPAAYMLNLAGLTEVSAYWIQTDSSDGEQYIWYAVYSMDWDNYQQQLSAALSSVQQTASAEQMKQVTVICCR